MDQISPASDQTPDCRSHFHCSEGTCFRFGFSWPSLHPSILTAAWKAGWGILIPSRQSARLPSLRSCSRLLVSPAQTFHSFSSFSSSILISSFHLKSSSLLINTVSLVLSDYVRDSKRSHLWERDGMCITNLQSHSKLPWKNRRINNALREFQILLRPSRKKDGPFREHLLLHIFDPIWTSQHPVWQALSPFWNVKKWKLREFQIIGGSLQS